MATKAALENQKLQAEIRRNIAEARSFELLADGREIEMGRLGSQAGEHGMFTFYDEVNYKSVATTMSAVGQWSRRFPGRPLTIMFNSPGGSCIDGLALFDFLQEIKERHSLTTVTLGMAASMGGILLQAGDHRVAGANSFVLIHEVSGYAGGKITELKDEAKFYDALQDKCMAILAERSTMTVRQIKSRMARQDWWLDADEALKLGFVDEIRGQE